MCHYITATLPNNAKPELVASIFESHKLGFKLISNPHISTQIDDGDMYVLTTRGQCDCGTVLGFLNSTSSAKNVSYERELRNFRKKGWSETKIQRWLEQKEQAKDKHLREDQAHAKAGIPEADKWIEFITDLLKSGCTRRLGLLLHWYHGSIESERISILGREKIKLGELKPEQLMKMKEDLIYEFVN
ncbi:MAG: hypothetical protein QOC96_271 [Acidobacteriota bacterium]|jgi:hypothetical protein|nr:hypothetical protein [Acidobacteriota bacterium]